MARIFLTFLTVITILNASAQDDNELKTIFGNKTSSNGGYGALMVGYTQIADKDAILIGARGAWIINHNFGLGIGGYGFTNDPFKDPYILNPMTNQGNKYQYNGGYGGLILEPIIGAKSRIHLSIPILIGAGGIAYMKYWADTDYLEYDFADTIEDSDAFFVVEPGLELEFNLVKFMRLALYGSYRYTSNIHLNYSANHYNLTSDNKICCEDMLRGMSYGIVLKFGRF